MSDAIQPPTWFHRMSHTPLRDVVRGRLTARLDVEGRMRRAGLPAPTRELIRRVVRRTRLWRTERADVADELIAHFADGLEGGRSADELIASFGDERRAAKLIRRAKRRSRPLPWHGMVFLRRLVVVLAVVYLLLAARFYAGRPSPGVDRLAELNRHVAQVPEDQRAWPLYRDALVATGRFHMGAGHLDQDVLRARPGDPRWPEMAEWLSRNGEALEPARRAAGKPALGLQIARRGHDTDPALQTPWPAPPDDPEAPASQAHVVALWYLADALAADAYLAAERSDLDRAVRDLAAVLAIAGHVRQRDEVLDTESASLGRLEAALDAGHDLVARGAGTFTPAQLQRLAHAFAEPDSAAEIVGVNRAAAYEQLRRAYTDDGDGDGRLTPQGVKLLDGEFDPDALPVAASWVVREPSKLRSAFRRAVAPLLPLAVASRRDATEALDRLLNLAEQNLNKPLRQADWAGFNRFYREQHGSAGNRIKYAAVTHPGVGDQHERAEVYLGNRDGLLIAIALELYRRDHGGRLPETLDALSPALLPGVPVDRITGGPLRYRVVDGKPVVYSVGVDGDDDGGRPAVRWWDGQPSPRTAARRPYGNEPMPDGDWVLFPAARDRNP